MFEHTLPSGMIVEVSGLTGKDIVTYASQDQALKKDPLNTLMLKNTVRIKDLGPAYKGSISDFRWETALASDHVAAVIAVTIATMGPMYEISQICSVCGHRNDLVVDLSQVKMRPYKKEDLEKFREGKLFETDVLKDYLGTVWYSFITVAEVHKSAMLIRDANKRSKNKSEKEDNSYCSRLALLIKGVGDDQTISMHHAKIVQALEDIPQFFLMDFSDVVSDAEGGLDATINYTCEGVLEDGTDCESHETGAIPLELASLLAPNKKMREMNRPLLRKLLQSKGSSLSQTLRPSEDSAQT